MDISNKSISEIIEENNLNDKEIEWLERVVSMMACFRKHKRLSDINKGSDNNEFKHYF